MPEQEKKPKLTGIEIAPGAEKLPEAPKARPKPEVGPLPEAATFEVPRPRPPAPPPLPASPPKDPILTQVETILSEDLKDLYAGLPADIKPKFRAKGEEVASAIKVMIESAKVKTRKVLKLIRDWLRMIPGVNKFFLEQSAAIKTQKITFLAEQKKKK